MARSESGTVNQGKLDRELVGDPVTVGEWTVVPEARLHGGQGSGGDGVNGGSGARLRLDPVAVTITDPADGSTQRLEIEDTTSTALRGMATAGMIVAGISLAVQLWARARRKK